MPIFQHAYYFDGLSSDQTKNSSNRPLPDWSRELTQCEHGIDVVIATMLGVQPPTLLP